LPIEIIQGQNADIADINGAYISPLSRNIESFKTKIPIDLNREKLIDLLDQCNWNKAEVGRRIQKSRTSVWKYMKKWDIPLQK
ncbi:diguanylate cyclase, partial [bacterium]|nr:diguanylate cyclase [bacterium]